MKKNSKKTPFSKKFKTIFWIFFVLGCLWLIFAPPMGRIGRHQVEIDTQTSPRVDKAPEIGEDNSEPQYTLAPFVLPSLPGGEEAVPLSPAVHGEENALLPEGAAPEPRAQKAKIAIVIDDIGPDFKGSEKAINLPAPVTLSLLPYSSRVRDQARDARNKGHEILLHMPMEPQGREYPGANALLVDLPMRDLQQRLEEALASFTGFDGVNNHMGSKFTAWPEGMEMVVEELGQRGLFLLDSRTSSKSVGLKIADQKAVPAIGRDVFLDDIQSADSIRRQLAITERIAHRKGYAVAIGHPHAITLEILSEWIKQVEGRGIELVPLKELIKKGGS